ncbi:MAG: hypothetical protein AAF993_05425 [Pseudomonadota bacterium]
MMALEMRVKATWLGLLLALTAPAGVLAHTDVVNAPVVHNCTAPIRPQNEQDDLRWQAFLNEVETFRRCVTDKMEWHRAAAAAHQQNASEVVQAWNQFVRVSLNAPEDFPWHPDSVETEEAE